MSTPGIATASLDDKAGPGADRRDVVITRGDRIAAIYVFLDDRAPRGV